MTEQLPLERAPDEPEREASLELEPEAAPYETEPELATGEPELQSGSAAAPEARREVGAQIDYRLLPLMRGNFIESNPVPVKAALAAKKTGRKPKKAKTEAKSD